MYLKPPAKGDTTGETRSWGETETQIAREITGKTHCQPDHTTVNGHFSCPMGLSGPADESYPVFDKITCSGCLVTLIGQTLKLIVPS